MRRKETESVVGKSLAGRAAMRNSEENCVSALSVGEGFCFDSDWLEAVCFTSTETG